MFHAIVAARTRAVWRRIDAHDVDAPWAMAVPDLRFEFVGSTPLSTSFVGRDRFRDWLSSVFETFPDLRFYVADVAVAGWPWRTSVAVRLDLRATLRDGSLYENRATQWVTLRWGRMTDDWVLEDTAALNDALERQRAGASR